MATKLGCCGCGGVCCGKYALALIFCGTAGDYFLGLTDFQDVSSASPPVHGETEYTPITDPGTGGCACRVLLLVGSPDALENNCGSIAAALETEFGVGCVTTTLTNLLAQRTDDLTANENMPGHYDGDALCKFFLALQPNGHDMTGTTSYRLYKNCTGCAEIASGDFTNVLDGEGSVLNVCCNNYCCCRCCVTGGADNGKKGFFREWDVTAESTPPGGEPACCAAIVGATKTIVLQTDAIETWPENGATTIPTSCFWVDDEEYYKVFSTAAGYGYRVQVYCGGIEGTAPTWMNSPIEDIETAISGSLCRENEADNTPIELTVDDSNVALNACGITKITLTPVAGTWQSCFNPLPTAMMGMNPMMAARSQPQRITLDCIHLGDTTTGPNPRRSYRECEKGHGPQTCCDKPQRCGPMCADYTTAEPSDAGDNR